MPAIASHCYRIIPKVHAYPANRRMVGHQRIGRAKQCHGMDMFNNRTTTMANCPQAVLATNYSFSATNGYCSVYENKWSKIMSNIRIGAVPRK